MIVVNAPLQRNQIVALLDGYDKDGLSFKLAERKGMELFFETNQEDKTTAARLAREIIKAEPWGSILYFQVSAVN